MSDQNWRTEVDSVDYFGHQKKRVALEQRRPIIRRASDLVGPGLGAVAVRITDYNSVLATYNGYYSSEPGALNAPVDEVLVMTTVSDDVLGGRQTATSLTTGYEYSRAFVRRVGDPTAISWGEWQSTERVPASATLRTAVDTTNISSAGPVVLKPPSIDTIGLDGTYSVGTEDIFVMRPGVYTGYIRIEGPSGLDLTTVTVLWPDRGGTKTTTFGTVPNAANTPPIPFTFWSTGETQEIRVSVAHADPSDQTITWSDFAITRVGEIA